jgi:hypothetical protein
VYYDTFRSSEEIEWSGSPYAGEASLTSEQIAAIAWTMAYGTITSGTASIPVNYTRDDDSVLTTTFDIHVTEATD